MTFIYNYFSGDSTALSERENAALLKALLKDHKAALKVEHKQYELEYKQALKDAEAEYKHAKKQAEEDMYRKTLEAVKREVDIITTTDEYADSDEKTRIKIAQFQNWMGHAAAHKALEVESGDEGEGSGSEGSFVDEKANSDLSV
ncbi:hypothetical protein EC957_009582 [Mortierella hygrophila]|uniref:Uncharacterized protein n=1 Tax=Mortierella hygrophila TaxID=979708 RepID=A0A9P6EX27_9FUNG|nr:hypothetical protein EC957_009582 [Mortierella hygrophila]